MDNEWQDIKYVNGSPKVNPLMNTYYESKYEECVFIIRQVKILDIKFHPHVFVLRFYDINEYLHIVTLEKKPYHYLLID